MDDIVRFFDELTKSNRTDNVPFHQRKYNGVVVTESELSYEKKISSLYFAAVGHLLSLPTESMGIVCTLVDEVGDCQGCFDVPSDETLCSLMHDYKQSNHRVRTLKEDYDYLCFVRGCMRIQMCFLQKFKKLLQTKLKGVEEEGGVGDNEMMIAETLSDNKVIKGVKGLATHLKIGVTKAQNVLNSKVLQNNGVAYRVGNSWNINAKKLDELLSNNPNLLYERAVE